MGTDHLVQPDRGDAADADIAAQKKPAKGMGNDPACPAGQTGNPAFPLLFRPGECSAGLKNACV